MNRILEFLFPQKADNVLNGSKWPLYFFILITVVGTVRSLIHVTSPDGGAGSIAGINLNVTGANEVVFAFALWGAEQLVYALIQWIVIWRYRSLIPMMWVVQLFETLGRVLVGNIKPVSFELVPPGQIGNIVFIPLCLVMLVWSLWSASRTGKVDSSIGA